MPQMVPRNGARKRASEKSLEMFCSQILWAIRFNPSSNVQQIMSMTSLTERTVKKYIKVLKENNAITRVGTNRKGYWQINDDSLGGQTGGQAGGQTNNLNAVFVAPTHKSMDM